MKFLPYKYPLLFLAVMIASILTNSLVAQIDFQPSTSEGVFLRNIHGENKLSLKNFNTNQTKTQVQPQKKELERTNNSIDLAINDAFESGKILFNDPISDYLNEFLESSVQEGNPWATRIRVFCVKSTHPGIFCTDDGVLLVNMGLLARLEDESQLAFVLLKAIAHAVNQHNPNIKNPTLSSPSNRGVNWAQHLTFESPIHSEMELFSEAQIEESNKVALEWLRPNFLMSPNIHHISKVYNPNVLPLSSFGVDEEIFNQFWGPIFQANHVSQNRSENSKRTEFSERSNSIQFEKIGNQAGENRNFLNEDFQRIIELSQFETALIYYNNYQYKSSIFLAYALLQKQKNIHSFSLRKLILKNLLGISKLKEKSEPVIPETSYSNSGELMQNIFKSLSKLKNVELDALALKLAWELQNSSQKDQESIELHNIILNKVISNYSFLGVSNQESVKKVFDLVGVKLSNSTKKSVQVSQHQHSTFLNRDIIFEEKETPFYFESLILARPTFVYLDATKDFPEIVLDKMPNGRLTLMKSVRENAALLDFKLNYLKDDDSQNSVGNDLEDVSLLKDWIEKRSSGKLFFKNSDKLNEIISKNQSSNLIRIGVVTVKRRPNLVKSTVKFLIPYWGWTTLFAKNRQTLILVQVFDLKSGEILFSKKSNLPISTSQSNLNIHLYKILKSLSNQKKLAIKANPLLEPIEF
jgi:hypothetical protein